MALGKSYQGAAAFACGLPVLIVVRSFVRSFPKDAKTLQGYRVGCAYLRTQINGSDDHTYV